MLERDLLVRARSRGTYWGRFGEALCGLLVCLPQFAIAGRFTSQSMIGKHVFDGIVVAVFVLSCFGWLLTADAISAERREGTLGLLLLTRVKAFDLLMGKLGSTALASLGGLVTLLPLLMLPVLAGGVTLGEAFRKVLACLDSLFFALALGLYYSAAGRERFRTAGKCALTIIVITLVPVIANALFSGRGTALLATMSSLFAFVHADDSSYQISPLSYWISFGAVQVIAWLLLQQGAARLPSVPLEERTPAASPLFPTITARVRSRWQAGTATNTVEWLVRRQPGLRGTLWAGTLVMLLYQMGWTFFLPFRGFGRFASPLFWWIYQLPVLAAALVSGILIAWAASRFSLQARSTGELELLLTTPAGVQDFVSGQWKALQAAFRGPIALLLIAFVLRWASPIFYMRGPVRYSWPDFGFTLILNAAGVLLGIAALCWLGMWFGFTARRASSAILWTVGIAKGVPFLISYLGMGFLFPYLRPLFGSPPFSYTVIAWLPQLAILYFYLWTIRQIKARFAKGLTMGSPRSFSLSHALAEASREASTTVRKARHWTPSG